MWAAGNLILYKILSLELDEFDCTFSLNYFLLICIWATQQSYVINIIVPFQLPIISQRSPTFPNPAGIKPEQRGRIRDHSEPVVKHCSICLISDILDGTLYLCSSVDYWVVNNSLYFFLECRIYGFSEFSCPSSSVLITRESITSPEHFIRQIISTVINNRYEFLLREEVGRHRNFLHTLIKHKRTPFDTCEGGSQHLRDVLGNLVELVRIVVTLSIVNCFLDGGLLLLGDVAFLGWGQFVELVAGFGLGVWIQVEGTGKSK